MVLLIYSTLRDLTAIATLSPGASSRSVCHYLVAFFNRDTTCLYAWPQLHREACTKTTFEIKLIITFNHNTSFKLVSRVSGVQCTHQSTPFHNLSYDVIIVVFGCFVDGSIGELKAYFPLHISINEFIMIVLCKLSLTKGIYSNVHTNRHFCIHMHDHYNHALCECSRYNHTII